jgi:diguanylate cyclase (GGDEF)-like protein/PAS domain S-box-containing protein
MTAVHHKASSIRLPLWAAAFVVLICVVILGLSGSREWGSRARELKNAEIDMANLARSLTQHADDSFDLLDASILGIVGRLETEGTGPVTLSKLEKILQARKAGLTRIHGLFIYDENGAWLATSENLNLADFNNSDRDYFQHHKQSAAPEAWIGPPVKSRSNGDWVISVSRRFNHPDGGFAGVVSATVGTEYFSQFYRQFDIGENGAIALLNAGGIILARNPDDSTYVGRDLSNSPLFRDLNARPANGVYYFKSPLDGLQRLSFYKRSDRWPLVVLAISDQNEILAPWRKAATIRVTFVLSLILVIATIGSFLVRQLNQRQRLTSALVAKEADFRLLAEESSDMVTRIGLDERLLYVSPSSVRIVGWSPEQLTGTPALAGVNADDLPNVRQTVAMLRRGDVADARIVYRSRHRATKEIWIESTMRVTRSQGTGRIDGVVAVSRDVTQQKNAEEKLAALATLDGLTGLANRRCFDERLQDEWARAQREGSPLSLLMIDVDHFKKFNDQYGHPAGDTCLQAVARALAVEAGRPGDLAARYGGEEFVLLLPSTDEDGARMVGERLQSEIRKLAIVHALNPPSLLVTVSLGGATMRRTANGSMEGSSLIQAADQALYVAKDSGRDRLVMSLSETPELKIAPSELVEHWQSQ